MIASELRDPGHDWIAIITRPTIADFARAFVDEPELRASVLPEPAFGVSAIRAIFAATRAMYEAIAFTEETRAGSTTFLQWEGSYRGSPVAGVTLLDHDPLGRIARIRLFHQPYDQVVAFAADLAARLISAGDVS